MKKISFALCLIMTMLCSCQETESVNENKLLGEWELSRLEFCDESTGEVLSTAEDDFDFVIKYLNVSNSAILITEYDDDDEYDEDDVDAYMYVLKDNKLSLYDSWGYFGEDFIIEKLTNKELVLSIPDHYYTEDDERIEGLLKHYFKK